MKLLGIYAVLSQTTRFEVPVEQYDTVPCGGDLLRSEKASRSCPNYEDCSSIHSGLLGNPEIIQSLCRNS
jgi:hypothetical protein